MACEEGAIPFCPNSLAHLPVKPPVPVLYSTQRTVLMLGYFILFLPFMTHGAKSNSKYLSDVFSWPPQHGVCPDEL